MGDHDTRVMDDPQRQVYGSSLTEIPSSLADLPAEVSRTSTCLLLAPLAYQGLTRPGFLWPTLDNGTRYFSLLLPC